MKTSSYTTRYFKVQSLLSAHLVDIKNNTLMIMIMMIMMIILNADDDDT